MIHTHFTKSHLVCENDVCGCPSNEPLAKVLSCCFFFFTRYTYYAVGDEYERDEREVDLRAIG